MIQSNMHDFLFLFRGARRTKIIAKETADQKKDSNNAAESTTRVPAGRFLTDISSRRQDSGEKGVGDSWNDLMDMESRHKSRTA